MAGNLLGQQVDKNVGEQIKFKQQIFGAGYNDNSIPRSPQVKQYLNNRNAWIKLASGVSLGVPKPLEETITNKESEDEAKKKLKGILQDEGFFGKLSESEIQSLMDDNLAKNFILFNGTQKLNKSSVINNDTQESAAIYSKRSGVRQSNSNILENFSNLYGGIGGNSKGLQPMPGITDISIDCVNRGSIRKATVKIKAFNKLQFNIIELLYLRLGYLMMLEWGWDKYIHNITNDQVDIRNIEGTIVDTYWFDGKNYNTNQLYNLIEGNRLTYKNNYDGFLGKVTNFEWTLNNDNTYDITLKLITIGSIIESLNMNQPIVGKSKNEINRNLELLRKGARDKISTSSEKKEDDYGKDNDIITSMGSDKFTYYLLSTIYAFPSNNKNYLYLPNVCPTTLQRQKIPPKRRHYVRFGTLIEKMDSVCNFITKNGNNVTNKLLNFDTDEFSNKCCAIRNLVPLKPDKVFFSYNLTADFRTFAPGQYNSTHAEYQAKRVTKSFLSYYTSNAAITFGRPMNTYFNIYFVMETFKSSMNSKGEVPVFTFLEKLCDAINESTGNVTALEPVIKNDRDVYFLDQNPIVGQSLVEPSLQDNKDNQFQIYGYDSNGESNFVKSFDFKTKITPDLSAQISIGATSNGSDTKNIDAFPLRNWNKGLINKFEANLTSDNSKIEDGDIDEDELIRDDAKKQFAEQIRNGGFGTNIKTSGGGWRSNGPNRGYSFKYENITVTGIGGYGDNKVNWSDDREDNAKDDDLLNEGFEKWKEGKKQAFILAAEQTQGNIVSKTYAASSNYLDWMVDAFGGNSSESTLTEASILKEYNRGALLVNDKSTVVTKTKTKSISDSLYFFLDDNQEFQDRGKSAFKLYQQKLAQIQYEQANIVSSTNGFIPLDLGLTFDGLSGIKIYNRIEVNTKFLPYSYPKSLKFIATKVDHSVKNNQWETKINTLSVPVTDTVLDEVKDSNNMDGTEITNVSNSVNIVKSQKPFRIFDYRTVSDVPVDPLTYGTEIDIFKFVSYFNINAQPIFQNFITQLSSTYPGYTLGLNGVFRTFKRSYELKYGVGGNENNAAPGKSLHNYALAFDANITDPNGKVFKKKIRAPWVESGIPKLAVDSGLVWGGSFSSYVDCVHFGYEAPRTTLLSNAEAANTPKSIELWETKNTKLT